MTTARCLQRSTGCVGVVEEAVAAFVHAEATDISLCSEMTGAELPLCSLPVNRSCLPPCEELLAAHATLAALP